MARAKPARKNAAIQKEAKPSSWHINEDWLATAIGLALILYIRLADVTVKWPIFKWFEK